MWATSRKGERTSIEQWRSTILPRIARWQRGLAKTSGYQSCPNGRWPYGRLATSTLRSPLREVAHIRQGRAQQAMANHEREGRPLLLGQSKELRRKFKYHAAVERHRDPEAVGTENNSSGSS